MHLQSPSRPRKILAGITANVALVGLVSFLTDASSEMIFPLVPVFLSLSDLGQGVAPALLIGLLEGFGEAVSALLKLFAGLWTDRFQKKKPFILAGYGLSSLVRPFMGLVTAWWQPVVIRVADRIGKGIRTAPRDVLIAESAPREHRGKAFGFHRSMDHLGAVAGPLLAVALLHLMHPSQAQAVKETALRSIFLFAFIPGAVCLAVILFVRDVRAAPGKSSFRPSLRLFGADYRYYLACVLIFTLGNSSDMFLIYRAAEIIQGERGLAGVSSVALVPLLWAFFHVFKSLATMPFGSLSDRVGRLKLIGMGWAIYALVYLGFAFMDRSWQAWPLFAIYALYYGLTEGVEKAFVVDLAPKDLKGMAVGMFHFTVGIAALPASLIFGFVYARLGALAAFGYAAALAMAAVLLLMLKVRERWCDAAAAESRNGRPGDESLPGVVP